MTDAERIAELEAKLAEAERERDEYRAKAEAHTRLGLPPSRSEAWSHYAGKMWGVLMERDKAVAAKSAAESREKTLREALEGIVSTAVPAHAGGDAPGHGHKEPGIWDRIEGMSDLGACVACAAWRTARAALAVGEKGP